MNKQANKHIPKDPFVKSSTSTLIFLCAHNEELPKSTTLPWLENNPFLVYHMLDYIKYMSAPPT